jgi:hypothetical protein
MDTINHVLPITYFGHKYRRQVRNIVIRPAGFHKGLEASIFHDCKWAVAFAHPTDNLHPENFDN